MAISGDTYHPGFIILYKKGLMYYSTYEKKFKLLKTGKKRHYISESNALRIVRYLYYPTGKPKPGRSIHDPLSKMYGLQKQRLRYAKSGKRIGELTLTGKHTHAPKQVLKEKRIKRTVRRYKKPPVIKESELPANTTTQMKFHVNRRQNRLYAGAYKMRLTKGDGSPLNDNLVISRPSEIAVKLDWIAEHVIKKGVLDIAVMLQDKYGKTSAWMVGGQIGYVWVRKNQRSKTVEADENGKTVPVVRLNRKDFKELVVRSFSMELHDAVYENVYAAGAAEVFKSGNTTFRLIQITSFTVKLFTSSAKLTSQQKTYAQTVGIYPRNTQAASWKSRQARSVYHRKT